MFIETEQVKDHHDNSWCFVYKWRTQYPTVCVYKNMDQEIEEKLVFNAQWFQSEAAVTHDFVLNFFTKDNSLELVR